MAEDLSVTELEITKEALEKLGITTGVIKDEKGNVRSEEERADLYAKHFCRLWRGIRARFE